jgi:hypothetical protein
VADHVFVEGGDGACYADFGCGIGGGGQGGFGACCGNSTLEGFGLGGRTPDAEVGDGAVHILGGSSE